MRSYFIYIPNTEFPTAEVLAPDTRHARTTYLDYLSRSGLIEWGQRQEVRRFLVVDRMQPGEHITAITLNYNPQRILDEEDEEPLGLESVSEEELLEEQAGEIQQSGPRNPLAGMRLPSPEMRPSMPSPTSQGMQQSSPQGIQQPRPLGAPQSPLANMQQPRSQGSTQEQVAPVQRPVENEVPVNLRNVYGNSPIMSLSRRTAGKIKVTPGR